MPSEPGPAAGAGARAVKKPPPAQWPLDGTVISRAASDKAYNGAGEYGHKSASDADNGAAMALAARAESSKVLSPDGGVLN